MAKQTLNNNSVQPLGLPDTGSSTEMGDSWNEAVAKLNAMFTELYANFTAGGGTATLAASGLISKTVGPIGSSATNTTQTLASYVLPASTLNASGQEVDVVAWGTVAGNAAPKTIQLGVGGAFANTGTQTGSGYAWQLNSRTIRSGASTQNNFFSGVSSGTPLTLKNQTDTSIETGTILIAATCADASAAQSNILLFGLTVEYFG